MHVCSHLGIPEEQRETSDTPTAVLRFHQSNRLNLPQSSILTKRVPTMPAIKHPVKINVDLGEGYGNFKCGPDDELIPLIDHANIACGFHAG